ncbi:hypothetical protein HY612_04000 [Candidatus Roizmanbacteria bacterium]|nr:hypothetical protein [Candidatus Roizmanbacteria bacterium]
MNIILMIILGIILFLIFNFLVGMFGFNTVILIMLSLILAGIVLGH